MKPKYINSGKCRLGEIGTPTDILSDLNEPLYVGDIVISYSIDEQGHQSIGSLTAIVSDKYTSYAGNPIKHKITNKNPNYFVMGLKSINTNTSKEWSIRKVKSYKDVLNKERWSAFNFNYS